MQYVSEQFKTAMHQLSREMKSRIIFPDLILDDTVIQRIEWDSTLIGMDDFEIGTAPMDMVRIRLISEEPINYKFDDTECNIELGLNVVQYSDISHLALSEFTYDELSYRTHGDMAVTSEEYVSLGLYTVEKTNKKGNVITLECIDRMYKFEKPYISTLAYPATLAQIAQDICSIADIELATTAFPNSTYSVGTKPELTDISCRVAIAQIAELAGGYARITRDGKLEVFNVKATALTQAKYAGYNLGDTLLADELIINDIEITGDNYIDFANKELPVAMIDKLIVKVGEVEAVRGAGNNPYYIKDNLFCQNPSAVVDDLYSVLNELSYIPFTMKWQGNPAIDCGDAVTIYTKLGYYNTLVTRRSLVYTGGLREDYEAVGKSNVEKESTPKGSLTIDTEKAKVDIRRLDDEISSKVSKGNIISEINQTAEEVKIQASRIKLEGIITANGNFKVLEDGSIETINGVFSGTITSENGEIGGFNIGPNGLTKSFQKTWGPYIQADVDRLQQILLRNITPTQLDYEKYDINSDGVLNLIDMFYLGGAVNGQEPNPLVVTYTITLNTADEKELIKLTSTLGYESILGPFSVDSSNGRFHNLIIGKDTVGGGWEIHVDQNGELYTSRVEEV